jgi:hypothetical protein
MDNHPPVKKGSLLYGSDAAGAITCEWGRGAPGGCGAPGRPRPHSRPSRDLNLTAPSFAAVVKRAVLGLSEQKCHRSLLLGWGRTAGRGYRDLGRVWRQRSRAAPQTPALRSRQTCRQGTLLAAQASRKRRPAAGSAPDQEELGPAAYWDAGARPSLHGAGPIGKSRRHDRDASNTLGAGRGGYSREMTPNGRWKAPPRAIPWDGDAMETSLQHMGRSDLTTPLRGGRSQPQEERAALRLH